MPFSRGENEVFCIKKQKTKQRNNKNKTKKQQKQIRRA